MAIAGFEDGSGDGGGRHEQKSVSGLQKLEKARTQILP